MFPRKRGAHQPEERGCIYASDEFLNNTSNTAFSATLPRMIVKAKAVPQVSQRHRALFADVVFTQ